MPFELVAVLKALGAVAPLVKEVRPLVESIRSGFMAKNEEAKKRLAEALEELEKNLEQAGALSRFAESYFEAHENISTLLSLGLRVESSLKDHLDVARDRQHPGHAGTWKVLETIFEGIRHRRELPHKVILDRAEWYDGDDKSKIDYHLSEFTSYFEKATVRLEARDADRLLTELQEMTRHLTYADTLVRDTLLQRILPAIQELSP